MAGILGVIVLGPLLLVGYVLLAGWVIMLLLGVMHNNYEAFLLPALGYWDTTFLFAFAMIVCWLLNPRVK